jgi:hypothetical protein
MLSHSTRLAILDVVDSFERMIPSSTAHKGAANDRWYPRQHELNMRGNFYDAWDSQLRKAIPSLRALSMKFTVPDRSEIDIVIDALGKHLSGTALTNRMNDDALVAAFKRGQKEQSEHHKKIGGTPKKASFGFGAIFGLTESHAISSLSKFKHLSAGGFWDDEMSDIVRNAMELWFSGFINRKIFADNIETLVNDRLAISGEKSKPRAYFDFLATTYVVTTRSVGNLYRAKELGAIGGRYRNPAPKTELCIRLTSDGKVYAFSDFENDAVALIGADNIDDLKQQVPFSATERLRALPPLHPFCKDWIEYVYKGLND